MFHNIVMFLSDGEKLNRYLLAVAEGDKDALDGVYALVGARMYAVACSIVGRAYAEDVVHDSFIKIARFARRYKSNSNACGWVMKIVKNTALDYVRASKREVPESQLFNLSDGGYSPDKMESAIALEQALLKLSPEERKVIYMVYYLDMTVREVAAELKTSKSTVQRIKGSAEINLKNLLDGGTNGI